MVEMQEIIGKVKLDYQHYSGQDFYSDGEIEDELLEVVKNNDEEDLYEIINQKNQWEYLYHFSQFRKNIVTWIPMKKDAKILEVGSGCGAITGALAEKGGRVDCVELSKKRSLINANRNKKCEGIEIKVGNFEEIEPYLDKDYDIITLIGVWEYANLYLTAENPFRKFLQLLKKHLKPEGQIVIAIENKYGLKYWAGCREDHTARFFEGVEGYTNTNSAVTFGKNVMQRLFEEEGYHTEFYYPYPDYKFPFQIFSDDYLPQMGMLNDNGKNFDLTRMVLFDEEKVYNSLIEDGMFPFFSNSFLVLLTVDGEHISGERVIYSKYSNERVNEFQIRTDIIQTQQGDRFVRKYPMHPEAGHHIQHIYDMYGLLEKNNSNPKLRFNNCKEEIDSISFEYIAGDTVEKELSALILSGQEEVAQSLVDKVVKIVKQMANTIFEETEDFCQIFGHCPLNGVPAIQGADIDLIFGNIIHKNDTWNIIDYEWSFDFPIPVNYILYRSLYLHVSREVRAWNFCEKYGIGEEEQEIYAKMEDCFTNRYVYNNRRLLADSPVIKVKYQMDDQLFKDKRSVKIYYDYGEGLSEENACCFPYGSPDNIILEIPFEETTVGLRIDPMEHSGIVNLKNLVVVGETEEYEPEFSVNGCSAGKGCYIFDTSDPWFYLPELKEGTKWIHVELSMDEANPEMVEQLVKSFAGIEKKCVELSEELEAERNASLREKLFGRKHKEGKNNG